MQKNKLEQYAMMSIGTIGIVLIVFSLLRYNVIIDDRDGFTLTLFGFIFATWYIGYLEKKSGISKKAIMVKSSISAVSVLVIMVYLFPLWTR